MTRAVLLRHDTPDGTGHFDLLIELPERLRAPNAGERTLLAFRVETRIDLLTPGQRADAQRLPDHRALYLDFEGDISGARGRVTRVARATCEHLDLSDVAFAASLRWGDERRPQRLLGGRLANAAPDAWRLAALTPVAFSQSER